MSARDIAVPVVLGLIVAAALWAWDPAPPELSRSRDAAVSIDTPYVLIPTSGTADHTGVLLRYNATPRHHLGGILDLHPGALVNGTWRWDGTDTVCLLGGDCSPQGGTNVTLPRVGASPGSGPEDPASAAAGVFGPDGLQANVTFYIFTTSGHLLASNAPRTQWEVYDLHGDFSPFGTKTWWFGAGPPPEGVADVPAYKAELRRLLWGTPDGGVQSALLEHHEYDWLVGPLWMTVRVDAVA